MRSKNPPEVHASPARYATHDDSTGLCPELPSRHPEIKERLDAIRRYREAKGRMTQLQAAEVVGHGLSTLKEWINLLEAGGPANFAKCSTRPHNTRPREKRTLELVVLISNLRNKHFAWGSDKIYSHLQNLGWEVSEATIDRIIGELLRKSKIKPIESAKRQVAQDEKDIKKLEQKRPKPKRKHAVREKPELAAEVGDRIEADTLEVPLTADVKVYIVNAVDKVTRRAWALLCIANNSTNAAKLLDKVCEGLHPKRIQTDGGSEFRGRFEERYHKLGTIQHILRPRSPKLNGQVHWRSGHRRLRRRGRQAFGVLLRCMETPFVHCIAHPFIHQKSRILNGYRHPRPPWSLGYGSSFSPCFGMKSGPRPSPGETLFGLEDADDGQQASALGMKSRRIPLLC